MKKLIVMLACAGLLAACSHNRGGTEQGGATGTGAGGTGTYQDPITFATAPTEWPPGTRLYVPYIQRYVIMEDLCASCVSDWSAKKYHIDIWVNSNGQCSSQVIDCENTLTQSSADVEVNPPPGRPVITQPLFNTTTCECIQ